MEGQHGALCFWFRCMLTSGLGFEYHEIEAWCIFEFEHQSAIEHVFKYSKHDSNIVG